MKPKIVIRVLLLFVITSGFLCSKDDKPGDPDPPGGVSGVYVAYSTGRQHYNRVASYWHDGTNTVLLDRTSKIYLSDIAVADNGDVYTAGCECTWSRYPLVPTQKDDSCKITVWKNTQRQQLTQVPFSSITEAYVFITPSGDIYVAGTERDTGPGFIRLWKNGIRSQVSDLAKDAEVSSLYVQGNDVYIGGFQREPGAQSGDATLWKNGVAQTLTNTPNSSERVVAIQGSGNDIYAAIHGNGANNFVIKNGTSLSLPSGIGFVNDIFLSGNDLYILSHPNNNNNSAVWKNGTLLYYLSNTNDPNAFNAGEGLFVKNGDVYVSGASQVGTNNAAVVWKNGAIVSTLAQGENNSLTEAKAIVVK